MLWKFFLYAGPLPLIERQPLLIFGESFLAQHGGLEVWARSDQALVPLNGMCRRHPHGSKLKREDLLWNRMTACSDLIFLEVHYSSLFATVQEQMPSSFRVGLPEKRFPLVLRFALISK